MADYVHNLHLLVVGVQTIDMLKANIENIRREYQTHVDDLTYKAYISTKTYIYVD